MTHTVSQEPIVKKKSKKVDADRVGVFLSVLCAIHCAVTPFLLILAPSFGKIWSHPASHWGMALFVVPIAFFMVKSGYKKHRKKWILTTGAMGIFLVLIGSALPYIETDPKPDAAVEKSKAAIIESETEGELVFNISEDASSNEVIFTDAEMKPTEGACGTTGCVDNCCPSLITDADGNVKLNIPPASIVTTLGGIALIVTHIGNICCCSCCQRRDRNFVTEN